MKTRIGDRLDFYDTVPTDLLNLYGRAYCPVCGNFTETIFARVGDDMLCRNHPDHPLFEEGRGGHDSDDPIRYPTLHHGGV